jgi:hypothetical protein
MRFGVDDHSVLVIISSIRKFASAAGTGVLIC